MTGPKVHPWWCDCAGCWTGITVNARKPLSLFQRLLATLSRESSK